jgi:hypothetical protein
MCLPILLLTIPPLRFGEHTIRRPPPGIESTQSAERGRDGRHAPASDVRERDVSDRRLIALGGSAIAINKIKANSVGTKQLKNNAVTSPKVADGSLLGEDFAAGQLPAGAPGAAGAPGPTGPQGATGTVDTSNFYDKAASDARFLGIGATAANSNALPWVLK